MVFLNGSPCFLARVLSRSWIVEFSSSSISSCRVVLRRFRTWPRYSILIFTVGTGAFSSDFTGEVCYISVSVWWGAKVSRLLNMFLLTA